ncbi:MAG: DUF2339 domain-containing protein [Xanthomonadales bacterium]|nr:DUF2339 domain-containing protein [Xanthomonadales bacterium]
MAWLLAVIGLIVGLACAEAGKWALGAFGGALIGALAGAWITLRSRIDALESRLQMLQAKPGAELIAARPRPAAADPVPASGPLPPPLPARPIAEAAIAPAVEAPAVETEAMEALAAAATEIPERAPEAAVRKPPPLPQRAPAPVATSEPNAIARWLFESSWIAKIGIGLVLIGVGALLRFAVKEGWLDFPIEMRLAAIAAAALAALAVGWRQREGKRIFALNLQGGAIAVLMMVVFAAYRLYHLIPAEGTFALLVILVAGCSLLAIRQNSLGLAVFGVIGGFAAPILASKGEGNHVVLFAFYLILNLGILAMSWARGWRLLNTLGFLFTFVIGTFWGVTRYRPEDFASTEPFLIAFFFFYLAIPLLPTLRGLDPTRRDHVEGSLVFGTPLVGFALQSAMLHDDRPALALTALVMALIYVGLARFVWQHAQLARWRAAYAGLALVFVTLVFPLAFTSGTTTVLWAIEGALLVWIGLHQDERRLRLAGIGLQAVALFALLDTPAATADAVAIMNPRTLGALAIAMAALFSAWRYTRAHASHPLIGALAAYGFGAWYVGGVIEVDRLVGHPHESHAVLAFVALSAAIAALLRAPSGLRAFAWPGFLLLATLWLFVPMTADDAGSPLSHQGAWIWPLAFACVFATLHFLREPWPRGLGWAHALGWLALPSLAAFEVYARSGLYPQIPDGLLAGLGGDWRFVLTMLPFWLGLAALLSGLDLFGWPLREQFAHYRQRPMWPLLLAGTGYVLIGCLLPGRTPPIGYLPLLNPLELSQVFVLLLIARFATRELGRGADALRILLALLAFVALSAAVLRGVHHLGQESWSFDLLGRPKAHAALSWTWTLLGAAAMGFGARAMIRGAWIAGAALLGVVVLKLLLIDMHFLGTLSGIASVLGVGVLFVALGYFAPMPAREPEATP